MRWYYISCRWATGGVKIDDYDNIIKAPPIWRRFLGQSYFNLINWLKHRNNNLIVKRIK